MNLVEQARRAGVVGAGGGGFPAHVKLAARADTVIANGAECEPLLHKDAAVMEWAAERVVKGLLLARDAVGATRAVVAVKAKNTQAVEAVRRACEGAPAEFQALGDYYPAGDEYDLVYAVTGRLIPPGGLPIHVGAVVQNVETLANLAAAAEGRPVTHKTLTVAGAVRTPATFTVPIGTPLRALFEAAGGLTDAKPLLCLGGLMMGQSTADLDTPVTKTLTGVVVLPGDHPVARRKLRPAASQAHIGKSACDQCRYCTEYCPRYLLGYAVEPHQVMRGLGFTATGAAHWNEWAALCCSCGLCTLFACPEDLYPKEACDAAKVEHRKANWTWDGPRQVKPHPIREGRRVPSSALVRRMHLGKLDLPAPYDERAVAAPRLTLLLKQHAGAPANASVRAGQRVAAGEPVAAPAEGALGAVLHAPCRAEVLETQPDHLLLQRLP
ncbi:MAG: SLBB domain-containing protein [Verrucomicrobiae bacterium]|nr:SLBB domain-containing protein [Verrucomicrobiae bacterium]